MALNEANFVTKTAKKKVVSKAKPKGKVASKSAKSAKSAKSSKPKSAMKVAKWKPTWSKSERTRQSRLSSNPKLTKHPFGPADSPMPVIRFQNYLAKSTVPNSGYGLFAGRNYKKGETVEANCYMAVHDEKKMSDSQRFKLECYWFTSPTGWYPTQGKNTHALIIMGPGSQINCGYGKKENVIPGYDDKVHSRLFRFRAARDIRRGEEFFHDYGDEHIYEK